MPPSSFNARSRNASTCSPRETSTRSVMARTPLSSDAVSFSPPSSTSARAKSMPSRAKASAIARPRPLAAPVTAATFPFSSFMLLPPRVPEHGGAADQDQPLHEKDMQPGAHARHQPSRDRASRNARYADHHAGEERRAVEQVEALEQRRLDQGEHER